MGFLTLDHRSRFGMTTKASKSEGFSQADFLRYSANGKSIFHFALVCSKIPRRPDGLTRNDRRNNGKKTRVRKMRTRAIIKQQSYQTTSDTARYQNI